jgi:copper oxidase (laccase) domain-containing protein
MELLFSKPLKHGIFEVWNSKPSFAFIESHQTHSRIICHPHQLPCEADGIQIILNEFSNPVAIKTADCLPVLIEGENGISFIHAGWKGLSLGILQEISIQEIKPIRAFIGPCIHKCCFEVSEDFHHNFSSKRNFKEENGKFYFDLIQEATNHLKDSFNIEVLDSQICTCCNQQFNSFRRNKTNLRNYNVFRKGF